MAELKPRRGAIALCSRGYLGLITEDEPKEIEYPDGNKGLAWVGIQLTDKKPFSPDYAGPIGIGTRWSSRTPKVLGYVGELEGVLKGVPSLLSRVFAIRAGLLEGHVRVALMRYPDVEGMKGTLVEGLGSLGAEYASL